MSALLVFVGPSLTSEDKAMFPEFEFLGPAAQGDILRCIRMKPSAIGLIDGFFGDRLAVHQKEILEAMASGIPVWGGASMGALRAAELSQFGMQGVGVVFNSYIQGKFNSDADIAVSHAPEELGFRATSISIVDIHATIESLQRRRILSDSELDTILEAARSIHFSERTWTEVARRAKSNEDEVKELGDTLVGSAIQQKRLDAIELVRALRCGPLGVRRATAPPPMTSYYETIRTRAYLNAPNEQPDNN